MVDLNKIKSIKVKSDGTSEGTVITTSDGTPIHTVIGLEISMNAETQAARLKMEVVLPALELEIPMERVDLEIASIRECPECSDEISPTITSREIGEDKHEAIVVYECKECKTKRVYPFTFDWDSVPKNLSEYNDGGEEETEE